MAEPANQKMYFWDKLDKDLKTKIKNQVLNTLISENQIIMRSGANVISAIAFVEVPRG